MGEVPTITCVGEGSRQQETVDKIWQNSDLWNTAYQGGDRHIKDMATAYY